MSMAGSIKVGVLSVLLAASLLSGCGGDGGSSSQTVSQLPGVTAPELTTPTQPQKSAPTTTPTTPPSNTPAPTASSTGASSRGQAPRRRGGSSKPAKETKAQRQKQKSCEKQTAQLPAGQQRQALGECLNPTPAPQAPETSTKR
jgi:hypothetical protein